MAKVTYLKISRLNRGISQKLAGDELGVSRQYYNLIENGNLELSTTVRLKLIRIYKEPISRLLKEVNVKRKAGT